MLSNAFRTSSTARTHLLVVIISASRPASRFQHPRFGRNPYDRDLKTPSQYGVMAPFRAAANVRSSRPASLMIRCPPFGLGILTSRIGPCR
ncbi:MAG: hypothetical protein JWO38_3635 [Gemmataceae bacterium]|nr:hypothetical protein [Gemmataceae bacterium]